MAKRPSINEMMATVSNRLGKTTGASKGSKPTPKSKVKIKPRMKSVKIELTKKF